MKKLVLIAIAAAVVALPACGAPDASTAEQSSVRADRGAAFIAELTRIDPRLTDTPKQRERALRRVENTCREIRDGYTGEQLVRNNMTRYSGSTVTLTPDQTADLVIAAKRAYC